MPRNQDSCGILILSTHIGVNFLELLFSMASPRRLFAYRPANLGLFMSCFIQAIYDAWVSPLLVQFDFIGQLPDITFLLGFVRHFAAEDLR